MAAKLTTITELLRLVSSRALLLGPVVLCMLAAAAVTTAAHTPFAKQLTLVARVDVEGGGMVDVKGNLAAVGHMEPPYATTLLDISDPAHPRVLSRVKAREGTHSHKARICGNLLVINVERYGSGGDGTAGLALLDITNPHEPKEIAYYKMGGLSTGGTGVHRFQLDCERQLVYASGSAEGFQGNFTTVIDVSVPARPREVGRWWVPGQHIGAGEKPSWSGTSVRTHHPLRLGNRLYVSLWYGGFAILDITDPAHPRLVSHINYHGGGGSPTHTALPVAHQIMGKHWLVVFDEEMGGGDPPAFMRMFDITDEKHPVEVSSFQVPPSGKTGGRFGAHQPHEFVGADNLVYAAWFSGGLRVIDISNPYSPREVGNYIPRSNTRKAFAESNDLFVDERGLIYLIDRVRGLDILKVENGTGASAKPLYTYTFRNDTAYPLRAVIELYDEADRTGHIEPGKSYVVSSPSLLKSWKVDARIDGQWQQVLYLTCDLLPGNHSFSINVDETRSAEGTVKRNWTAPYK